MSSRSLGLFAGFFVSHAKILPGELPLDQIRIFGEKKDASLQPDLVRPLSILRSRRELITLRL